jgi:hypothetical protein
MDVTPYNIFDMTPADQTAYFRLLRHQKHQSIYAKEREGECDRRQITFSQFLPFR